MFNRGDRISLPNGFPVIVTAIYSAHDGMAYRVKPDTSALEGADLATLKSTKAYPLTAEYSHRCTARED
jgi:hypothetical protein